MKIYHKFLLYQNKWIHPYVRMILGIMTSLTYLASLLLIVGVVYEHGFTISAEELRQLHLLYRGVWTVFMADVTLRILLEYKDTRRTFSKLTWILTVLLYLTLVPVIFHRPEEEGAILQFWDFLHGKTYQVVLLLLFSFLNISNGLVRLLGRRYQCGVCHRADFGRCGIYVYSGRLCGDYPPYPDRRFGSDDADQFFCDVLYGEHFFIQPAGGA